MAALDYETLLALAQLEADQRGRDLEVGVAEALACLPISSVRELRGALDRVFAVQERERRTVAADEVPALLGTAEPEPEDGEFDEFLAGVQNTVSEVVSSAPTPAEENGGAASGESTEQPKGAEAECDGWFLDREKIVWAWPYPGERLAEELD